MAHIRGPITTRKGPAFDVAWRDPDGRFRQERVYGGIRKAEQRAKAIDTAKHEGRYHDDRAGKRTFQDVAEEWLDTLTRPRPETVKGYSALLELHAYPAFADRHIRTIKPGDLGRWINDLKAKPGNANATLHPTTIKKAFSVVKSVFRFAVAQGLLLSSPAEAIALPTEDTLGLEPFQGRALSLAEVDSVAAAADDVDPVYGLVIRFLAATGLRASELSGLRLQDVSPDRIRVTRTASRDGKAPGGIRIGVPKSRTSRREIPILDAGVGIELAAHIADHPQRHDPNAPVFPCRKPGGNHRDLDWSKPIDPGNFRRRVFEPACEAAGVGKVRLHDLRHTAGTLWLAAGVSLFRVGRYLGHSSVDFTARIYGHVLEQSAVEDAARFAAYRAGTEADNVIPFRQAR